MKYTFYSLIYLFALVGGIHSTHAQTSLPQTKALEYRNIGPTRGGRATTVTGVVQRPNEFYMGSTGGGLWKTKDFGQSWNNVSDGYFSTPSLGAVRVAPSNPDIVYAGTGSDGIRSNVITGKGMYKSVDAGETWEFMGLQNAGQIGAVEIDPQNPDRVFVAVIGNAFAPSPDRGLYRSLDGGKNWEKVLYHSDSVGVADVEFAPDDPNTLYASLWRAERKPWTIISGSVDPRVGGIYKSTDGGDTWKKLEKGLPQGIIGKIDLAVSAAAPERLYALVEAPAGEGGLYLSDNRGQSFVMKSSKKELIDRPFYYCNVDVNPGNPEAVYVSATQFWRSYDGGKSWKRLRTPHGDNHDLWINPEDTAVWVQCNDGGANVTLDNGATWSRQSNQSTAELYQVEVDDQFPYWLYAGQQDNSTISVPSLPPYYSASGPMGYWMAVGGCETGPAVPKPGNPNIVYANCKGRFGVFDKRTGQERNYYVGASNMYGHNPSDLKYRFQRVSPIHVSPHNPDVVYHTSQFVHKTTDDGFTWETISPDLTANTPGTQVISGSPITRDITGEEFYSTIYAIRESPRVPGLIWVGANDGPVHLSRDGGQNWKNVTPAQLGPGGRIDCVEPSPHQDGKAYFTCLRYMLDDWKPYIYKTEDYGETWTLLSNGSNGIPADYPVRVVREDPEKAGVLYAGTEFGMFLSLDDGKNWVPFQQNLPITPITDIKVFRKDLILSTMGRGFWILDDISMLQDLAPNTSRLSTKLFRPRDTHRMRYRGSSSDEIPHYPSPGLILDYTLDKDAGAGISLEILDDKKRVIRLFVGGASSGDAEAKAETDMATGFRPLGNDALLNTQTGAHRVRWDMRHEGAWHANKKRSGNGGPLVAPGTYTARLKANGQIIEQNFQILPDPRVIEASKLSSGAMKKQEELNLKIRDLLSESRKMENQVSKKIKELEKKVKENGDSPQLQKEIDALQNIHNQLSTAQGRYRQPMLVAQISYLYNMLIRADQLPGQDAYERYEELSQQLEQLKPGFKSFFGSR